MKQITSFLQAIKNNLFDTFKTLYSVKWYILFYWILGAVILHEYINPPAKNDAVFYAGVTPDKWIYTNQDVYVGSMGLYFVNYLVFFLFAVSNLKNHPKMARFLLLLPWISSLLSLSYVILSDKM